MKAFWTALFLLGASIPLAADVTKEDVLRLLRAHVSDQTLISYVQKNGPMAPLSIEDLTELKNAGASDDVLRALLDATRPSDAVTPAEPPPVLYDDSPRYYYYPYYVPYTFAPTFYYGTGYGYRTYPRSYYPYPATRPYPYSYSYGRTPYPYTTTVPRVPVQPGGVHSYRPTQPPRTSTSPPPPARPRPSPQNPSAPRGHVPYR